MIGQSILSIFRNNDEKNKHDLNKPIGEKELAIAKTGYSFISWKLQAVTFQCLLSTFFVVAQILKS
jgi:hypothetical protein